MVIKMPSPKALATSPLLESRNEERNIKEQGRLVTKKTSVKRDASRRNVQRLVIANHGAGVQRQDFVPTVSSRTTRNERLLRDGFYNVAGP